MLSRVRTLFGILTVRQWWGALGLVLLLVLLWVASRWYGWPTTVPLTGTVVLLAVGMVALLVDRFRAARQATALERSLRTQAEEQLFGSRPDRREQVEQIEREFAAAVEALKKSKVGQRRPGRSALYTLPWYAIIGPPAAGKTTAITESGLDFPLGANRVRGIGGTRNCDWFFATSAILLDTAGRYMTVEEDRDEWLTFLGLLKRYRGRAPLNGVLVVVSIDELLNASPEESQQLAVDLRHRIDELVAQLGVRFPLYLVFTKCDLLRGFREFFADLDPAARNQVWGATLPGHASPDDAARAQFVREFDALAHALVDWRAARLAALSGDPELAREVYLFPLEFASIRDTLAGFVGQLLQSNPYQDTPQFRGFYFTSALQGGASLDRVLPGVAERYELSPWDSGAVAVPEQSRSYFLGSLFGDVIVRDRGRVTPTSHAASARERMRRGTIAATALGFLGFAWLTGAAYARSASDLKAAEGAVATSAGRDDIGALDSLERMIRRLEGQAAAAQQLRRLGLDRSGSVLPGMRTVFARRALPYLQAPLIVPIEGRLRGYTAASQDARDDLHAYLLLGPDVGRLRESAGERQFLRGYLRRMLRGRPGDTVYTNRFAAVVDEPVLRADSQLVARTRELLYMPPTLDGLYAGLRQEGARLPARTLGQLLGPLPYLPFEPGTSVPGLYTREAWESFVQDAIEARSREPGRTDWVVGARPDRLPPELADPDSVAGTLLRRYFADYIAAWQGFLVGVRYVPGDPAAVARSLQAIGDPAKSPLAALLDSVGAQTRFENATVVGARRKLSDFTASMLRKFGYVRSEGSAGGPRNPVDRTFAPLHALREGAGGAALGQLLAQYQQFGQAVQAMAPQLGSPAAATQLTNEAARARVAIAPALPSVDPAIRAALFERPYDIAVRAIEDKTARDGAGRWSDQVCRAYKGTLAGRYPFDPSGQDAAFADVERFFQPQSGTIWGFFDRELSSTLSPTDFQPLAGVSPAGVPQGAVPTLRRARRIRDGLFAGGGGMRVEFQLTPLSLAIPTPPPGRSVEATRICLTVDGREECYHNGERVPQAFEWPSRTGQRVNRVVATVAERGKPPLQIPLERTGDWGWFRLLDAAQITSLGPTEARVTWSVPVPAGYAVRVTYALTVKGGTNPFTNPTPLAQFECAP